MSIVSMNKLHSNGLPTLRHALQIQVIFRTCSDEFLVAIYYYMGVSEIPLGETCVDAYVLFPQNSYEEIYPR